MCTDRQFEWRQKSLHIVIVVGTWQQLPPIFSTNKFMPHIGSPALDHLSLWQTGSRAQKQAQTYWPYSKIFLPKSTILEPKTRVVRITYSSKSERWKYFNIQQIILQWTNSAVFPFCSAIYWMSSLVTLVYSLLESLEINSFIKS